MFASKAPRWPQPHFNAYRSPHIDARVAFERGACTLRLRRVPGYLAHFIAEHLTAADGVASVTVHADWKDPLDAGVFYRLRVFSTPAVAGPALVAALDAAREQVDWLV